MTFLATWFAPWLLWTAWLLGLGITAFALHRLWRTKNSAPPIAWAVGMGLLALLWLMNVDINGGHLNGMSYHLLGLNLLTLMLGAPAAWTLACAWLLAFGVLQHGNPFVPVFALNALLIVLPTVAVNVALRRWALHHLPKQVFVYIFVNAFISGALGMLATGLLVSALLYGAGVFTAEVAFGSAFPVFFLLTWGEAFLSGIGTAVCVAFKPELLATFDDDVYLMKHNQIWK